MMAAGFIDDDEIDLLPRKPLRRSSRRLARMGPPAPLPIPHGAEEDAEIALREPDAVDLHDCVRAHIGRVLAAAVREFLEVEGDSLCVDCPTAVDLEWVVGSAVLPVSAIEVILGACGGCSMLG